MKKGFTLIELLVVVLIIGILAAVALPQYQKAVMKSRFSSLKPIAKAVKDAQEMYFETYGHYATDSELDDLDIDIPEDVDIDLSETDGHDFVRANHDKLNNSYTMYLAHSENFANNIYCEALSTDDQAKALCAADGGKDTGVENDGYLLYLLSGNSTGGFAPTYIPWTPSFECISEEFSSGGGHRCSGFEYSQPRDYSCVGYGVAGCQDSSFANGANCWAYISGSCNNSSFTNGARCHANAANTCQGTYDETSCCEGGDNCGDSPRC